MRPRTTPTGTARRSFAATPTRTPTPLRGPERTAPITPTATSRATTPRTTTPRPPPPASGGLTKAGAGQQQPRAGGSSRGGIGSAPALLPGRGGDSGKPQVLLERLVVADQTRIGHRDEADLAAPD